VKLRSPSAAFPMTLAAVLFMGICSEARAGFMEPTRSEGKASSGEQLLAGDPWGSVLAGTLREPCFQAAPPHVDEVTSQLLYSDPLPDPLLGQGQPDGPRGNTNNFGPDRGNDSLFRCAVDLPPDVACPDLVWLGFVHLHSPLFAQRLFRPPRA